jgi:predicted lactoylglutathione lyase
VAGPQLNFLTLACADVERMADFCRALGWTEDAESEPSHRLFQGTNGIVVALYGAQNYERDFGPRAGGFRGFTLGLNLASPEEVDHVYEQLQAIDGAEVLDAPYDSPHGFRAFSLRDPEGNIWDVAWKKGSTVTPDGDLTGS